MKVITLSVGELDTNCYILYDETTSKALVVDPGDEASRILAALMDKQLHVEAVVLTHGHFDHMMAARAVCDATGAPLCAAAAEADTLADAQSNLSAMFYTGQGVTLTAQRPLRDGDVLSIGGERLTVLSTPGHTPGCICLLGEGLLVAGDTLFAGSIGRLDFPGGDAQAMMTSLARLVTLSDDLAVYPGHGPATTIGREKATNPYLQRL